MRRPRLIALLLALITLLVYLPVVHHGFMMFDDSDYITENRIVQHGLTLDGIKWAFTTGMPATGIRSRGFRTCWIANCSA